MPTYGYACVHCGRLEERVMSMREYMEAPPRIYHCGTQMRRHYAVQGPHPNYSDRHYDGLTAPDPAHPHDPSKRVLIDSKAKHREYMRANKLATVDDFKDTWKRAARERIESLAGVDPTRKQDIVDAVHKLEARGPLPQRQRAKGEGWHEE